MIKNYEKGDAIGTPSTFSINWRSSYNVGDKVRIRTDMVGVKNIDYNSDDNVFTIIQLDKSGATPFKVDSKGNSIGGFMRDENPSGVLYILDKNGGSWEGKDLEPYLEINQPISTSKIDKKIEVSNNLNKEEIQSLVDNFITNNVNEIQKISQDNPLLFESVTNILSFISTKLGTREGGIEIPKVEEPISTTSNVSWDVENILCYVPKDLFGLPNGFYALSYSESNDEVKFVDYKGIQRTNKITFAEFRHLRDNGSIIVYDTIQLNDGSNIYYFQENKNILLEIVLNTDNLDIVSILLVDKLEIVTTRYDISYDYNGDVKVGSFVVYEHSGKENFLTTIWRRISAKGIVLAPKSSPIVQTFYPQKQQTTTTATTTAKKGRKALSQDQKDRIAEIKLEIEGLELIAEDDDDAKEEIQKLKNELKQIKNS